MLSRGYLVFCLPKLLEQGNFGEGIFGEHKFVPPLKQFFVDQIFIWVLDSMNALRSDSGLKNWTTQLNPQSKSCLLLAMRRTRIVRYLSFTHGRFSSLKLARRLPELHQSEPSFKSLNSWTRDMVDHNEILHRGEVLRMNLVGGIKRLTFSSLDRYIMQIHAKSIAKVLNALSKFADRVIPLIQLDRAARSWIIVNQIVIQRRHWFTLARQVMNLLKLLGFDDARMSLGSGSPPWRSPWADFDLLAAAACKAAGQYGRFSVADI